MVLPLIPALAASSPFADGQPTGMINTRLHYYRGNQARFPVIAGAIIPEVCRSESEYHDLIFTPMMAEVRPYDPEGLLDPHFLNSRGAIARFDRGAIEIRLCDLQEHPAEDLKILNFLVEWIRALCEEQFGSLTQLDKLSTTALAAILNETIKDGEQAVISEGTYLHLFNLNAPKSAKEIFAAVSSQLGVTPPRDPLARQLLMQYQSGLAFHEIYRGMMITTK